MSYHSYNYYTYHPSKSALDYNVTKHFKNKVVHKLKWRIPKFSSITKCKHIRGYETEYVDDIEEQQIRIKIHFCGIKNNTIEIYFLYTEHVALDVVIDLTDNSNCCKQQKKINCEVVPNKWEHLLTLDKQHINNLFYRSEGFLNMNFNFTVSYIVSVPFELEPEHQLADNFKYLRSISSDSILKSAEGYEFKVHKVILSSRSTVLKAYFAHDTLKNNINIIESHLDTEVLNEVLTYIYTDGAPKVQQMADKLLAAAEFYHLPGLKEICAEMLYMELTEYNAIDTLQLADLYSATYLTKLTLEFIKDGHAALIIKTDSWKSIKSIDIIKTLYECVAMNSAATTEYDVNHYYSNNSD